MRLAPNIRRQYAVKKTVPRSPCKLFRRGEARKHARRHRSLSGRRRTGLTLSVQIIGKRRQAGGQCRKQCGKAAAIHSGLLKSEWSDHRSIVAAYWLLAKPYRLRRNNRLIAPRLAIPIHWATPRYTAA